VPVELHIHAARLLDDGVAADWIVEWADEDLRAIGGRGLRGRVFKLPLIFAKWLSIIRSGPES
jgi:hypothetical protein